VLKQKTEELLDTQRDLDALGFVGKDWAQTLEQHRKVSNMNELIDAANQSVHMLGDGEQNILSILANVRTRLASVVEIDSQVDSMLQDLEGLEIQLGEFNRDLRRYAESLDFDSGLVEILDRRIAEVQRYARKYGVKPNDLEEMALGVQSELEKVSSHADLDELRRAEAETGERYFEAARQLSLDREQSSIELTRKVNAALVDLAMSGVRFEARLIPKDEPGVGGLEQIAFYVATNPGAEAKLVGKVASGGELSRISLAIQSVVHQDSVVPTVIFDEVDSGVGGAVAEIVGKMLKAVGQRAQVLCVTHLPQVAALGDSHWKVTKAHSETDSKTLLQKLKPKDSVNEIARMLAGEVVSEQAKAHARELINSASM